MALRLKPGFSAERKSGMTQKLISRRSFSSGAAGVFLAAALKTPFSITRQLGGKRSPTIDVAAIDRDRILRAANKYLLESPVTITSFSSPRSAGGKHDYFSEGDYWWPDPKDLTAPYIQHDGLSNPDNFNDHRHALIRLSVQMPALTAAWILTRDSRYATRASDHLRAWFVNPDTLMNPNLQYSQAIHGRFTGRGIGIIDTLHLVEVARAASFLETSRTFTRAESDVVKKWFADYLNWMSTSKNGLEERDAKNNHGTCWLVQAGEFAEFTGNKEIIAECRARFKTIIVPNQIAANGSFPLELARTKPYGYSIFNLDAMATACQILSTPSDNLWTFELLDGRAIRKAMEYMFPFIANKKLWPLPPDVQYFADWPVRQPSLLFAGLAYSRQDYLDLWRKLDPDPTVDEIIRNNPIRQPLLWVAPKALP
jgi:hypothetical protein